jgi:endonuclease YncB( thermonuclease family)
MTKRISGNYARIVMSDIFLSYHSEAIDVCLEQVKAGFAWHYKKYQREPSLEDQKLYADAEIRARDERLGLWRENNPNPPWEYRQLYRSQ